MNDAHHMSGQNRTILGLLHLALDSVFFCWNKKHYVPLDREGLPPLDTSLVELWMPRPDLNVDRDTWCFRQFCSL